MKWVAGLGASAGSQPEPQPLLAECEQDVARAFLAMPVEPAAPEKLPEDAPFPAGLVVNDSDKTTDEEPSEEPQSEDLQTDTAAVANASEDSTAVANVASSDVAEDQSAESKEE